MTNLATHIPAGHHDQALQVLDLVQATMERTSPTVNHYLCILVASAGRLTGNVSTAEAIVDFIQRELVEGQRSVPPRLRTIETWLMRQYSPWTDVPTLNQCRAAWLDKMINDLEAACAPT